MRVLIFGNSGSGKSTRARALAARHQLTHLDLDSIVWQPGQIAVPRPEGAVLADLERFLAEHDRWVIEGCYGELVEAAARHSTELVFLNPGRTACLDNNTRRPWEPHKYASREDQDRMLSALQEWVAGYYTRNDSWSYAAHRRIFDAHRGAKVEVRSESLASPFLQRALDAIDATTRGITPAELRHQPDGRWSAAQILEHLALGFSGTTKGLERCLAAGKPSASPATLQHRLRTAVVVGAGYLPSGRQAPERTRPRGLPPEDALPAVRERLITMDDALARCERQFGARTALLDHPIIGPLSARQWCKFHLLHTRHHMKQVAQLRERR